MAILRVSVVATTYNHERFIARALDSVAEQDFPKREVETIVVDDGSTDGTPEIVQKYIPEVRLIRKANGGQVSAFHAGVAEARGEIIAFLDGDDWWRKDKLAKVVAAFDSHPEIAAVGHGYFKVDEKGNILSTLIPEPECCLSLETPSLALFANSMRIFLGTSRFSIRKRVLVRALPVPNELSFFDNFIFTQAIAMGGAVLLAQPLCYYRLHSGNLYASEAQSQQQLCTRYKLLCGLLEYLPKRLTSLGISDEAISALLGLDRIEAARLKLLVEGGKPWQTFLVESMEFRQAYKNPELGYRIFKLLTLLLTLLMPPKSFYRIRQWYSDRNLRRWRQRIGSAHLSVPHVNQYPGEKRAED